MDSISRLVKLLVNRMIQLEPVCVSKSANNFADSDINVSKIISLSE